MTKVKGEEIVKFLTDVFDALFSILVDPVDSILTELRTGRGSSLGSILDPTELSRYELHQMDISTCDRPVFDCLVKNKNWFSYNCNSKLLMRHLFCLFAKRYDVLFYFIRFIFLD